MNPYALVILDASGALLEEAATAAIWFIFYAICFD
jgi:hypothetical protein